MFGHRKENSRELWKRNREKIAVCVRKYEKMGRNKEKNSKENRRKNGKQKKKQRNGKIVEEIEKN